jgi:hypothetical protein
VRRGAWEFRALHSRDLDSFDLDSFDQGRRQPERPAQPRFFARHFTIIALMVKARQMKNPVQRQNLDFLGSRMSKPRRIL